MTRGVLGSGLRPECTEGARFGPMLISEMEAVLKSLDQRVGRIEQILPTLATKAELRDEIRGVKVLIEESRGDTRLLAEHMSSLMNQLVEVHRRLDRVIDVLNRLDRR